MSRTAKALVVAALHVALVISIGVKLLYDRATRPRIWVETRNYDPYLPVRGRYVWLRLVNNPQINSQEPVLYFIPEHAPDPTRRQPGEQLWVEVTLPKKGPPRPIRLGVKKNGGEITPLDLN
jgi:hypothetical protein